MNKRDLRKLIDTARVEKWKELDLNGAKINSLPPQIGELLDLEMLDLTNNSLQELPQQIANLKNLKSIDLRRNSFTELPPQIANLLSLKSLLISGNQITDIPKWIRYLKNLTTLIIGDLFGSNKIEILPDEIGDLSNLKTILMNNINIKGLPSSFRELNNLEILMARNIPFGQFPEAILGLSKLKTLYLSKCQIDFIPRQLGQLKDLEYFDISQNNLSGLPPELGNLKSLQILDISENKLTHIPDEIGNLQDLRIMDAGQNGIYTLPSEIGKLSSLQYLELSDNKLLSLPSEIGQLKSMKGLTASRNHLNTLPPELGLCTSLNSLDVNDNHIVFIPPEIGKLHNLSWLSIVNNPIDIPSEIIKKPHNAKGIIAYIASKSKQSSKGLNEVKLLIVGQGSVGKTSLVEQVLHGTFDQNQTKTEGISISQYQVEGSTKRETEGQSESIKLNIWDFGGQEIMHATHQFFLTKRSLYLLVLDARLTQEENRVEYWLKIIQSFGGESPVLIVGNKTDQHPLDIDRTGLQKKYPNIVGILETSAATGAGIAALKAAITKQVDTLPHVRDLLPETWFMVKSKLEELGRNKNFITQDEYFNLCGANEVTDETSQHTLIGFLHDLGVVLHFQDDPRLEALGILNPQWVTNGVYKILNSHELFQNQGTLTLPILNKTLNPPEYPSNKRLFIVDMMKKFELCYDIEPDKSFLIPDLLPKDEPFTGEWDGALAFQIHYNVLPSSIISRFIVRMNAFIHKTIWRSGVVLKRGDNTALIKADTEDKKIYIWVNGKEETRRDFLSAIRMEFDAIHKTIAKIEAVEKVPLLSAPEADPISLAFLQQLAIEGRDKFVVQAGNRIVDLLVKEVLSQIEKDGKGLSSTTVHNYNIQGNNYGSIGSNNTVNIIQQKFEPIYEAIESSSRDTIEKQDLVAVVDEIRDDVVKGDEVNETFLSRRLRNLKKMAPDIAEVALATLANPAAGVAMIVQKVARKIKDETK